MELIQLNLKNFRTHKKLELSFKEGITGIIGNNGAGKSSVIEAISFLLTGEGYGAKADMLSVGETSGYVLGHLKIDGKEAVLERHLDTSKVAFKYDGIIYKKAGEVSAIWEQLFQIDKNIFKNIIISKQGETALLFSGDNSIKEKIFQKIFLVPNTTKIRDTIWNKYIKSAPPEYPVLDEEQTLKDLINLESQIIAKKEKLSRFPVNIDSEHISLSSRQTYLINCKNSEAYKDSILSKIAALTQEQEQVKAEIETSKTKLSLIDYNQINAALQQLTLSKPKHDQKIKIEKDLHEIKESLNSLDSKDFSKLEGLASRKAEISAEYVLFDKEYNSIKSKIDKFKSNDLTEAEACPYCGSELKDLAAYLTHLEAKLPELINKIDSYSQTLEQLKTEYTDLSKKKLAYESLNNEFLQLSNSLDALKDIRFDEGEYNLYNSVINQYNELSAKKDELNARVQDLSASIIDQNVKLISVAIYDNATKSLDEELSQVVKDLEKIKTDLASKKELELGLAKDEQVLAITQKTFENNKEIKAKNEQRNKYLYILNELYELFHTSQFPRKLIQTYAGTVSEYLNEHLQLFNFPYNAKVNDNFGIDVTHTNGHKLPSVSGGQEIMIGVALRLALHNMFGSAFPMMILDEGSVHLSAESKKSYFEIIKNLKKISNFKQIIIVDHDDDLSSVVDNTIKL